MFQAVQVVTLLSLTSLGIQVIATECISFDKHGHELEDCCDLKAPFPTRSKTWQCEKYARRNSQRKEQYFGECLFQCIFETLGIVNGSTINEGKISEYLQEIEDESSRHFLLEVYRECGDLIPGSTGKGEPCNSLAMNLEVCVLLRLDADCPEKHYHQSEICDKAKAGIRVCE
nr:uncharacterized protein LOC109419750 [Aedes albopictus]